MRQPWWEWGLWQYRAVVTQANAAGGAITVDFAPLQGMTMIVVRCHAINSGTNSLQMGAVDEDNAQNPLYLSISSAGTVEGGLPRISPSGSTDTAIVGSEAIETRMFRAGDYFSISQLGAGAQNDTLTVVMRALLSSPQRPLVLKLRSTNQGDVTIATPTVDDIR